jgi:hypothetical protein
VVTPPVARLTWQAADPAGLAADLERRLGAPVPSGLEIVPWLRESPTDAPTAAGRLVFEPLEEGAIPLPPAAGPLMLVGVAWATVELDRAERELAPWLAPAGGEPGEAEPGGEPEAGEAGAGGEPHLGARVRTRATSDLPGGHVVLAEPATEGRLAASLARDGEGPCALYLRPAVGLEAWLAAARARGIAVSRVAVGPFGGSVLVQGAAIAGPHVIVVEGSPHSSPAAAAGTIAP